jgi:macrolide transport system ATP-binding/permease protein
MITHVLQDLRFAVRQLGRAPVFAASAILTLALGVGANTAIFSLLNGFLRPLSVPDADRLVVIAAELPSDETGFRYRFSYQAMIDYRNQADAFSDVFAFDTRVGGLSVGAGTSQFIYHVVTGNLFSGLRLTPLIGRFIEPGEGEHLGDEIVVVLGHAFWQKRFGGDPAVVGTTVRLDGQPAQIVGVAPPGFHGLYHGAEMEGYVTLAGRRSTLPTERLFNDRSIRYLTMLGRMKPGVSLAEAQASVDIVARRLAAQYPVERDVSARVLPEPMARPIPLRLLSWLLPLIRRSMLGLAALVLLIACMNVANLLLVRATVREREMAVRAALGSGRQRLIRLLLSESLVLAAAGTIAGLVLARWATSLFFRSLYISVDLPLNLDYAFDWRVFLYATLISAITGLLMGIVPALRASRAEVAPLLHDGGYGKSGGASRQRLRGALVIGQVTGSLVLLIVAGLFIRTLHRAQWMQLGFDPENVLTMRLNPHQNGYSMARAIEFYDELDRRLIALPGVDAVAAAFSVPMGWIFTSCPFVPEGQRVDAEASEVSVGCNPVTPTYFDTMRIRIVRGRGFTVQDTETTPRVIVVNETFARRLWPNQDPIGRRIVLPRMTDSSWQVVGVAEDGKYLAVFEDPLPHLYIPMAQDPSFMRVVHIRTAMAPEVLAPLVEREIYDLDPDVSVADVKTVRQIIQGGLGFLIVRIGALQATSMGLLGLLLSAVGVYGVVSYGASQRTREMGIRLALGAEPRTVRGIILRQGAWLVAAGIACGLVVTMIVTRAISRFFVLVSASDLPTFVAVTALLSLIALVACYVPARRAMRVNPIVALRHE